jgi:hypothetical protein
VLQFLHDVERGPLAALEVHDLPARVTAEDIGHHLDHLTVGEMPDLLPRRLHLLDGDDVEAGVAKIPLDDGPGDGIVSGADDALRAQRFHGANLVHA